MPRHPGAQWQTLAPTHSPPFKHFCRQLAERHNRTKGQSSAAATATFDTSVRSADKLKTEARPSRITSDLNVEPIKGQPRKTQKKRPEPMVSTWNTSSWKHQTLDGAMFGPKPPVMVVT